MSGLLVLEQCLNGLQFGVMLFLMAAGLTLVFGIMNLVNLAHGSLYMVGAYFATAAYTRTGSFLLGVVFVLAVYFVPGGLAGLRRRLPPLSGLPRPGRGRAAAGGDTLPEGLGVD